jgi:broad specificity phosphatase PhoE
MAEKTVVHLMRHGEVRNPDGILYGRLPQYLLSDLGHQMAQTVADSLVGRPIVRLVASPLERAQQTAAPVADRLGLPITTDERVIEAGNRFQGTTFGKGRSALWRPKVWWLLRNPVRPSWGEPYAEIAARMQAAIADARAAACGGEALIVSHQLPIWTARLAYEGRSFLHDPRKRECRLASLTSLHFDGDEFVGLEYSEPAGHLGGTGAFAGGH